MKDKITIILICLIIAILVFLGLAWKWDFMKSIWSSNSPQNYSSLENKNETSASADVLPKELDQCSKTKVVRVETRLMDCGGSVTYSENCKPVSESGSAIHYTNGGYQVSYEQIPAVDNSKPGDEVNLCLAAIPKDCPPGDDRGKIYHATNLRTGESWELPDSEHMCGGA